MINIYNEILKSFIPIIESYGLCHYFDEDDNFLLLDTKPLDYLRTSGIKAEIDIEYNTIYLYDFRLFPSDILHYNLKDPDSIKESTKKLHDICKELI